jgi:putative nucleotidyltransferase with HDIG domain
VPLILSLLLELLPGVGALMFYSMLSVFFGMDPVEGLLFYLMYGLVLCTSSVWMRKWGWKSFLAAEVLLAGYAVVIYLVLGWFTYMEIAPGMVWEGLIGTALNQLLMIGCYPFIVERKPVTKKNAGPAQKHRERSVPKRVEKRRPAKGSSYEEYVEDSFPAIAAFKDRKITVYKHSKLVAEIARQAAFNIGCDGGLAKAGGMYHEIGQGIGEDDVKESLAIISEYRLPKQLAKIVKERDGIGSLPSSKEAAVVMLSDAVVTALENNHKKDTDILSPAVVIENVLDTRKEAGKLKASGLSVDEIEIIGATFQKLLVRDEAI